MGLMRFVVNPPERIVEDAIHQAYMSGLDRIPWPSRIRLEEGGFVLERSVADSGNLHIPWYLEGHGWITLTTGSLMERSDPYHLPLELARGQIAQVRNQLFDWEALGLAVPDSISQRLAEAVELLSRAVTESNAVDETARLAGQSLVAAYEAGEQLAACYVEQALAIRRQAGQRRPCFWGANLGMSLLDTFTADQFLQTFDTGCIPLVWREVESSEGVRSWHVSDSQIQWCKKHRLKVCGGPLLNFDARAMPDWLYLYEEDPESIHTFASEYLQAVVGRYQGQVDYWLCAARSNTAEVLSLSEEDRVRLTARAIELVHEIDPYTPVIVVFDRPWGEYAGHRETDFPPLQFADALARAEIGLGGIMLEMNLAYLPDGTPLRSLVDCSRQVDSWGQLGLPLYIALSIPSSAHIDPLAQRFSKTLPDSYSYTPKSQQLWARRYLSLFLAKASVQGVLWTQLRDVEPHDFPHGGLFDLRRHPKPVLRTLASLHQAYLPKKL